MLEATSFSKDDLRDIAAKIRSDLLGQTFERKIKVFLCGADFKTPRSLRFEVANYLNGNIPLKPQASVRETMVHFYQTWSNRADFSLIYPEDTFDDLLYSPKSQDLLSLENLLAENIDALVVVPESPGSFAELGAFANSGALRGKMICIFDEKYKKKKSFINRGPIKLIKNANKNHVITVDRSNPRKGFDNLARALKKMPRPAPDAAKGLSLFQIESFLQLAIFLLEPIAKHDLVRLVSYVTDKNPNDYQMTMSGLSALGKKKHLETIDSHYKLSKLGVEDYVRSRSLGSRFKIQNHLNRLDAFRLAFMNYRFRGKALKI